MESSPRYLRATLRANDESTTLPLIPQIANIHSTTESFHPAAVLTKNTVPITPKAIEETMNTRVGRFCTLTFYSSTATAAVRTTTSR